MNVSQHLSTLSFDATCTEEPLFLALRMLVRAYQYAMNSKNNPWHFAIEIDEFHRMGVTNSELRWLLAKELVLQAKEVPTTKLGTRAFVRANSQAFTGDTCFVLSNSVAREVASNSISGSCTKLLRCINSAGRTNESNGNSYRRAAPDCKSPEWNLALRELSYGGVLVKRFKTPAPNQVRIIKAFHEEGWPPRIDDPLPPVSDQDSRRRLIDAIRYLNRNQANSLIRFHGDGTGRGILWELTRA